MKRLASTAQMKEMDRITIQERGIPSLELMEHAAQAVARAASGLAGPVEPVGAGKTSGRGVIVSTPKGPLTREEERELEELQRVVDSS